MKRILALTLAAAMALALTACGGSQLAEPASTPATEPAQQAPAAAEPAAQSEPSVEPVELIVFAAASMKETLTKIAELYKTVAPNVTLTFTFDSSGTLKTQIQEGADCDVFISAAPKQMNQLDGSLKGDPDKNPDGLDLSLIHI